LQGESLASDREIGSARPIVPSEPRGSAVYLELDVHSQMMTRMRQGHNVPTSVLMRGAPNADGQWPDGISDARDGQSTVPSDRWQEAEELFPLATSACKRDIEGECPKQTHAKDPTECVSSHE